MAIEEHLYYSIQQRIANGESDGNQEAGEEARRGAGEKSKGVRCIYSSDPMADSLELFERLGRGAKDDDTFKVEGGTRRFLGDGTHLVHRSHTSTPDSPAVEIREPGTDKVKDQKVHFILKEQ